MNGREKDCFVLYSSSQANQNYLNGTNNIQSGGYTGFERNALRDNLLKKLDFKPAQY